MLSASATTLSAVCVGKPESCFYPARVDNQMVDGGKTSGELHALSVSQACLRWHTDGSGVVLWLNPSFLLKRLSPHHVNQSIKLAAFNPPGSPGSAERVSDLLCLVRALWASVEATTSLSKTDDLFVCFGTAGRGLPCRNRDSPTGLWIWS